MDTTPPQPTQRGIGMAAAVAEDVILTAAARVEAGGYHSFWLNNPPRANALATLGKVGAQTPGIWLGVGVIPLSHEQPEQIIAQLRDNAVPLDRFYLGIGSGAGAGGVERVAEGIRVLRGAVRTHIAVAALGPRMCRLAGGEADGVLLNWITPEFARQSVKIIRDAALEAGHPVPRLMAYVRAALGEGAISRLRKEAANYENIAHYAAHFRRMGASAMETSITGTSPADIQAGLADWDGVVDEVVVRVITEHDTGEEVTELLEAARPLT